jgi:hypothetical protein
MTDLSLTMLPISLPGGKRLTEVCFPSALAALCAAWLPGTARFLAALFPKMLFMVNVLFKGPDPLPARGTAAKGGAPPLAAG